MQTNEQAKLTEEKGKSCSRGKGAKYSKGGKKKALQPVRNDWKFYAASEQLAKDAASIPYNYVSGGKFRISGKTSANVINNEEAIPGVMVIPYISSIGVSEGRADGVNNAAIQFYSMIRKGNSGAKNYEAPDLMMYVLALRDIYSMMAYGKQILGLVSRFDSMNINTPDLILRALGVDPNDLRSNIAKYRKSFNELVHKVNVFAMPDIFSVFARSVYIHSAVFMDSTSMRAQYYVFRKVGHHTWDGTSSSLGTMLKYHTPIFDPATSTNGITFEEIILTPLQEMVNAIYYDTDAQTMNGDILKAFNNTTLLQFVEVGDDYVTPFTVDTDILSQIENSHSTNDYCGNWATINPALDITQASQLIQFKPTIGVTSYSDERKPLEMVRIAFNSHKDNPDYKDNLEWSRLICTPTYTKGGETGVTLIKFNSTGLEIPIGYEVWYYDRTISPKCSVFGSVVGGATDPGEYLVLASVSNFDWHPIIYITNRTSFLRVFADLKLVTTIDVSTINSINNTAIFGAFYSTKDPSKNL